MIESIQFENVKLLRNTTLPLGRCTILVGPNGSGKSTVLEAIDAIRRGNTSWLRQVASKHVPQSQGMKVEVAFNWQDPTGRVRCVAQGKPDAAPSFGYEHVGDTNQSVAATLERVINRTRVFSFNSQAIAAPAVVTGKSELGRDGSGLAAVLDGLRDEATERFEAISSELGRWLPEFDRILFERPEDGKKAIALRTRDGHHAIPARDLSQGTLIALALLTLAYLPDPPPLIGLEEPDRGIHPRLLRRVQDALHRLSDPESCGETREPVQVIATTHSPYFLDLFKDHPEEIVIAEKIGYEVRFERLSEREDIHEILSDVPLGEAWYSGVLGGVPSES